MRVSKWAMAAAIAGLLRAGQVLAQQPTDYGRNPAPGRAATARSMGYESYYGEDPAGEARAADGPASPSDEPEGPIEGIKSVAATFDCDSSEEKEEEQKCCLNCPTTLRTLGDNVTLGPAKKITDHFNFYKRHPKWFASGWLAQSYTWNPYNKSGFNGPVTWTDQANQYQLNELYLYGGKNTDTGGDGWDLGGRIDAFYGSSYRWDTEAGLESTFNKGHTYGLAITQFYGEVAYNDLKVKVGHFISPVGYYTVGTYLNFFNTIPYTYQYGEPFTHTGVLANYQITEKVNWGAGVIHGWDNFDNTFNKHAGYLGTLTITGDKKDSLAWVQVYSIEPTMNAAKTFSDRYFQTLVYTRPFKEKWTYVAQSDFGVQGQATSTGHVARWYGFNQYLYWKKNDVWSWGFNFEWFRDEEGFRVGAAVPSPGSPSALGYPLSGFAGSFYQCTMGPRWTPLPNLTVRPNFRCDWYDGSVNAAGLRPFDNGKLNFQQILGTDVIMTF
ncbi:MAG TPA: outer membrane beta-barrel protein [Pirellulales bacterium]|nr:outer membrane beta-barrel protein [Pirellulales bacterium]